MSSIEDALRDELSNMQYESSIPGRGLRGLMPHHVEAIMSAILPHVKPLEEKAWQYEELCK